MTEVSNLVEATSEKTIRIRSTEVRSIVEQLSKKVVEKGDLMKKFDDFLKKFDGKAGLRETADIINRNLRDAQNASGSELIRKLELTSLQKNNQKDASHDDAVGIIQGERAPNPKESLSGEKTAGIIQPFSQLSGVI